MNVRWLDDHSLWVSESEQDMPGNQITCLGTSANVPLTLTLDRVAEIRRGLVGGKAANLAVLIRDTVP